jgi:hypothetical protein
MKKRVLSLVAALAFSAVAFTAQDASACGMSVRLEPIPEKPTPVQEIASGERALEGGAQRDAAIFVLRTFPAIRSAKVGADPLQTRGLRVLALAMVRSNGNASTQGGWTPGANLEWAAQVMREINEARPNDPTVQADMGEALAKIPRTQTEALGLLGKLAESDLMGSPHAYVALAIKRCEEMAKNKGVCKMPEPRKEPAVAPVRVVVNQPSPNAKPRIDDALATRF